MRRATTFAVKGDKYIPVLLPNISFDTHRAFISQAQKEGYDADRLEQWTTDGGRPRSFKVTSPKTKRKESTNESTKTGSGAGLTAGLSGHETRSRKVGAA